MNNEPMMASTNREPGAASATREPRSEKASSEGEEESFRPLVLVCDSVPAREAHRAEVLSQRPKPLARMRPSSIDGVSSIDWTMVCLLVVSDQFFKWMDKLWR